MAHRLSNLVRQPLLHFAILGALVFLVDQAFDTTTPASSSRNDARSHVEAELRQRLGREPTPQELTAAETQWRRDETAFRAALARGLGDGDAVVRSRLQRRFRELQGELFVPPEPTTEKLRHFFEERRKLYEAPTRFDFRQVFADAKRGGAESRAQSWIEQLKAGADPVALGDEFVAGAKFVSVGRAQVRGWFGSHFAERLASLPLSTWQLVQSKHGWHAVRVDATHGESPSFEDLRPRLTLDYQAEARRRYVDATLDELASSYLDAKAP
jgi:hypothetical protein